jgi:hypothetical protein
LTKIRPSHSPTRCLCFTQPNVQGHHNLHSCCDHPHHPPLAGGARVGLRGHPTVLPRLLPQLLHGTASEPASAVRNDRVFGSNDQGESEGATFTISGGVCFLGGEQGSEHVPALDGRPWCRRGQRRPRIRVGQEEGIGPMRARSMDDRLMLLDFGGTASL